MPSGESALNSSTFCPFASGKRRSCTVPSTLATTTCLASPGEIAVAKSIAVAPSGSEMDLPSLALMTSIAMRSNVAAARKFATRMRASNPSVPHAFSLQGELEAVVADVDARGFDDAALAARRRQHRVRVAHVHEDLLRGRRQLREKTERAFVAVQ